jgi:hypothetical protein
MEHIAQVLDPYGVNTELSEECDFTVAINKTDNRPCAYRIVMLGKADAPLRIIEKDLSESGGDSNPGTDRAGTGWAASRRISYENRGAIRHLNEEKLRVQARNDMGPQVPVNQLISELALS